MKAVLAPAPLDDAPNLAAWLAHARPAVSRLALETAPAAGLTLSDRLSRLNVLVQRDNLMTYPDVRTAIENGVLRLSAWWFDIAKGDMYAWQDDTHSFAVIDRPMAQRLTGGE